jgi:hypothetical protein
LPQWVSFLELAEMWHVPPWELEDADEQGLLLQWGVRAFAWRNAKNKREERISKNGGSISQRHW